MVPIARRNLFEDRLRLSLSVAGVALATMLVLLLNGFLTGMYRQITAYVDNTPADFYITQRGVSNFQGAASVVPLSSLGKVESVEGVTSAIPVVGQYTMLDLHGKKVTALLVGYRPDLGGGPWKLSRGRDIEGPDEVVVDRVLAERHNLELDGVVDVQGSPFRIVGLSEGTASWMVGILFLRHDAATSLLRMEGATSFILASVDGTAATESRLSEALPEHSVVPREKMASNDRDLLGGIFSVPLRMMVTIAIGIGGLLVGLTIYSSTAERVREYGVLKAIGMRNSRLYGVVSRQALGAAVLGFVSGLALVGLAASAIQQLWPQFSIAVDLQAVLQAAVGALAMAAIAALLPARYVASIDPARVFRR